MTSRPVLRFKGGTAADLQANAASIDRYAAREALNLRAGTHRRCPKCGRVWALDAFFKQRTPNDPRGVMRKTCAPCRKPLRDAHRARVRDQQALPGRFH